MAQTASGNYVVSNTTFAPNISGGFSISLWFSCSGQLNKRGTLISLAPTTTLTIPTESGLIYYFPFDGTNGSTTFTETKQNGTYSGGSATINTSIPVLGTGCLDCTGGKKYNNDGSAPITLFNGLSSVTMSVWIYLTALPSGSMCYVLIAGTNKGIYFNNQVTAGSIHCSANKNGAGIASSSPIFTPTSSDLNKWNHLVWTITNDTTWHAYLNGSLVAGFPYTATGFLFSSANANSYNVIGIGSAGNGTQTVNAYLDDLRFYNRALSVSEITTIYNYTNTNINKVNGLQIDVSGTNMIYSQWLEPIVPPALQYGPIDSLSATTKSAFTNPTQYTNGRSGIYGVKLLYSVYTGPVMRIRRNNDASQTSLTDFYADSYGNLGTAYMGTGTSLAAWLSAASATTAYVTTWYDQTGNGNHATQTDTTKQPTYNTTGKYINFTARGTAGTDADFLTFTSSPYPSGNCNYTYVVKFSTTNNYGGVLFGGDVPTNQSGSPGTSLSHGIGRAATKYTSAWGGGAPNYTEGGT